MRTAQIRKDTGLVFATVSPPLKDATPPDGVAFVDYDDTTKGDVCGWTYDFNSGSFTEPKPNG